MALSKLRTIPARLAPAAAASNTFLRSNSSGTGILTMSSIGSGSLQASTVASESYLAKPPGSCCLKGTLHEGKPRGSFMPVNGIDTYISRANPGKANGNILMFFPDVWGMGNNSLLVMDAFAESGYMTVGIDYFRGDPVTKYRNSKGVISPSDFDYEAWKRKHIAFADSATPNWVEAITSQFGKPETRYAAVGYCFGAPYVCDELARAGITAGAFAHPAFLKEHHFSNIKKPLFLSCSEIDHTFSKEDRRRAIDVLEKEGKTYQLQLFSGVEHGFALRGNPEIPYERYVKEQSLKGIVEWFDFWLAQ